MRNTCISCLAATILFINPSYSQETRNLAGKEFWMTFTENVYTPPDGVLQLVVAPSTADTLRVYNPQLNYSEFFPVKPGQQNIVALKFNYLWYSPLGFTAQNTGVRITSKYPVQIQAINRLDGSADAAAILPTAVLENAREYFYSGLPGETGKEAQAAVLAMDAGTTVVEFTVAADLSTGQGKGSTFTKTLEQGQVFVIQALGNQDLSGTLIKVANGSCKRISVFAGTKCSGFPKTGGCTSCDAIYEQLWPVNYFNREYFVPPVPDNPLSGLGIVAMADNTTININGAAVKTLSKGEYYFTNTGTAALVTANNPIHCNQILFSAGCNGVSPSGNGDPSLLQLASIEQTTVEAFIPVYRNTKYMHRILAYTESSTAPELYMNGVLVPLNTFQSLTIASRTFWMVVIPLAANQTYRLKSTTPFTAYSYGMADAESYACLAAASFTNITSDFQADPDIQCKLRRPVNFTGNGDSLGIVSWYFGDGNTATGTTASHTYGNIGNYVVQMLNSRLGSCPDTVTRLISVLDGPDLQLTRDTMLCNGKTFRVNLPTDKNYSYKWENGSASYYQIFDAPRIATLTTTDTDGCISSDTLNIQFESCDQYELQISNVFTPGNDGFNDEWRVLFNGYTSVEVQIRNRWGEVVSDYKLPEGAHWNGAVNNQGIQCPGGVYFYILKTKGRVPSEDRVLTGSIELLR